MKKTLVMAALTLLSASAFASQARLEALQNAAHLSDIQRSFEKPYEVAMHGEFATFEFGGAGTTAEGGFARQMGDSYLGLYLGHSPEAMSTLLSNLSSLGVTNVTGGLGQAFGVSNPVNIMYAAKAGDLTWGVNFLFLSSDLKASKTVTADIKGRKANVMGISGGVTNGAWDVQGTLGLAGKAEFSGAGTGTAPTWFGTTLNADEKAEITSKPTASVSGGYMADTMYYYGKYAMGGAKTTAAGADKGDFENSDITIGLVNTHKKDGTDFFYGVSYVMSTQKEKLADSKTETSALPLIIGVESEAASWLVFRAALTQNFIIGSKKVNGGDADTNTPNNTASAGVGMKWGKFMFDGNMSNGLNGDTFGLDGGNFITSASFTYLF